jgi:D-alanine transfer protein
MKRLIALLLASVLMLLTINGVNYRSQVIIKSDESVAQAYKLNTDTRNNSRTALDSMLDDNTVVVLGSSELSSSDQIAYPPYLLGNSNSDFKMVLIGRGYMQSLHHAMVVGAYADILPQSKVVFIVSPQWFTINGIDSKAYPSRFSETIYLQMMENPSLSDDIKQQITTKLKTLLSSDEKQLERISFYEKKYLGHNFNLFETIKTSLTTEFMHFKNEFMLAQQLSERSFKDGGAIKASDIDFYELMKKATLEGDKNCSNNAFGIDNAYFDKYIKDAVDTAKGSKSTESYAESPEYKDFELFLKVCQELHIDPLIVIVPVNGRWYDHTGFPKEGREIYYKKVKDICMNYGVETADFSNKEYEKYFLKDVMHMGWKGWVYFDEAVYHFFKK